MGSRFLESQPAGWALLPVCLRSRSSRETRRPRVAIGRSFVTTTIEQQFAISLARRRDRAKVLLATELIDETLQRPKQQRAKLALGPIRLGQEVAFENLLRHESLQQIVGTMSFQPSLHDQVRPQNGIVPIQQFAQRLPPRFGIALPRPADQRPASRWRLDRMRIRRLWHGLDRGSSGCGRQIRRASNIEANPNERDASAALKRPARTE